MDSTAPVCRDDQRRADILVHPTLNGIDVVEYEHRPADPLPHVLIVSFLKPLPDPPSSDPDGAYGLTIHPEQIAIDGGTRIVGLKALEAHLVGDRLEVAVDRSGDFSDYEVYVGWERQGDGTLLHVIPALDEWFSRALVNFKADCPVEFDCRPVEVCPPEPVEEPLIDYLAKDYASFRQLMLDRIPLLNPDWIERNPADVGMALVELLAYTGDRLSYFQDAVANEMFLDTVRQRVSAKRHARLIDYRMHDGRNAWTYIHLHVGTNGIVPQRTRVLSRITAPFRNHPLPPAVVIPANDVPDEAFERDAVLSSARVFETSFPLQVNRSHNTIFVHTQGNLECCMNRGTTTAQLYTLETPGGDVAARPELKPGDFLLFEEVKGPITGAAADANPAHRQVVRLVTVKETEDSAYRDQLLGDQPQVFQTGDTPLPLLEVTWRAGDALVFPLCLSTRPAGRDAILNVSVARGNIVLADHGRTVRETAVLTEPVPPDEPFRLRLALAPLTMQCQPESVQYDSDTGDLITPRPELDCPVDRARPALSVRVGFSTGFETWRAVPDLLDSPPFARHFVVDVDHAGRAELRFGDGEYGREVAGATSLTAIYRIGNGRTGNVGADALAHIVEPAVSVDWPTIIAIRNPLTARGGIDAEEIEQVRQRAPAAFHAEQFRAVTESDYIGAARRLTDVSEAAASFRWTGSWHTVFAGIDPRRPEDVITEPGGRTHLATNFAADVRAFLTRYRLAGYDMETLSAQYVPLDIHMQICVKPGYFRGDVAEAVRIALSNRRNPDGSVGFFHADRFTFGQPLYVSPLYAAVEAVEGVDSLVVTRFQRYGQIGNGELATGAIVTGNWEIIRLDNDRNFMENGVLHITAEGGK